MHVRRLAAATLLFSSFATAASAIMDWTSIGNSGNACDTQPRGCFGAVAYAYDIGTFEVTNTQYAEFLNAKAASDPFALYNPLMSSVPNRGGIARTGSDGAYIYSPITGREDWPVNFVSFYDAIRFANWMNNGQGAGDTETGAYALIGGTSVPSNGSTLTRNLGAAFAVPSEDEWYKAAYYDPSSGAYFDYPARSDIPISCTFPTATINSANCNGVVTTLTPKGSYTGSSSPHGTFDQAGNVYEWTESIPFYSLGTRGIRGAAVNVPGALAAASAQDEHLEPSFEDPFVGFRIVPEPGRSVILAASLAILLALAGSRQKIGRC